MSYCRFSSDDFTSDVYTYEDVSGGWTTHVAGNHIVWNEGVLDDLPTDELDRYVAVMNLMGDLLADPWENENYTREDVDHPDAGLRFNDPTPGDCADRLERYKREGLNVPQYAIDSLREEANAG